MIFVDYPGHLIAGPLLVTFGVLVLLAFHSGELRKAKLQPYRLPLILLQYVSILILLLILWNPSRSEVSETLSRNSVLALFDTSASMSVVEDGRLTRLDKALNIFEEKFGPSDPDGPAYKIFGFDRQSYHSGSSDFLRRWGPQTDMHGIFAMLGKYDSTEEPAFVEDVQNPKPEIPGDFDEDEPIKKGKVVGAVIFTDGQADDKNTRTYLPLRNKDFQAVFIGVGSRERHADLAIKSISAPSRMAIDTACNVQIVAAARNLQNQPVIVELLKDDYVIDSRQIPPEAFAQRGRRGAHSSSLAKDVTAEFTVGADRLGSHTLSARAKPLRQEVNLANNVRKTVIEVVDETKLKVLFYSQVANFNVGKVRQALARDNKIQLDLGLDVIRTPTLAQNASKTCGYVRLPDDRYGFYEYDVIILGPCELDTLTNVQIDSLYSFVVDRGGGLILLPGKDEFGPAAWRNRKAKALVPVIFDPDKPTIRPSSPGQIELTLEAVDSRVFSPTATEDYDEPTSPYYRVVNTKPASTTLALVEDTPIISVHRVGRGSVCLLNASKLFLWYREDLQGGLLQKVMAGLTAHLGRITKREAGIELFAEQASQQADKVKFQAYVCDDSFAPVSNANVLISFGDEFLSMSDAGQGHYVAEAENIEGQAIVATAQAEVDGVFLGEKTIAVNLPPAKTEMTNVELDEKFLRALAKKLNGKYFYADDIGDNIAQMFEAQAKVGSSRRIISIWPSWLLLMVLCVLLGISWFLRRAIGLV
ncbi:MAG: hypothetical protein PVJ86_12565 [Phycisphaerales bacterium]|jgi:hypothetical protein